MAEPIITQTFAPLMGDREDQSVVTLASVFSSSDSKNVRVDKLGRIRKIDGFIERPTIGSITTDTGGAATRTDALFQYFGGSLSSVAVGVFHNGNPYGTSPTSATEYEIHVANDAVGGTWTFERDLGTKNFTVGPLVVPTAFEYNDVLYMAIRGENPQQYDGTTASDAGPSQSPTPTLSATGTGVMLGTYQVKLVSMIDEDRQAGSVSSSQVQLDSEQASISWTADADTDVTGYELYSTTSTGGVFYFVKYIDGRTTASTTFNLDDDTIRRGRPLDRHGDAPVNDLMICGLHKSRGWWGRTTSNPSRLYYSDPFQPDEIGPNSFLDIGDSTLPITGLHGGFQDALIVFKAHEIFRITGTGELVNGVPDFTVREASASTGALTHHSIVRVPAGALYTTDTGGVQSTNVPTLAYWSPDDTIRLFSGDQEVVISHPKREFLASRNPLSIDFIWAEHDEEEETITWYFAQDPLTINGRRPNNVGVMWNYRYGVWTEITNAPFNPGTRLFSYGNTPSHVLMRGSNGTDHDSGGTGAALSKVYTNEPSFSYNGTGNNINAEFWTSPLHLSDGDGSAMSTVKRLRRLFVVTAENSAAVTVEWYGDYEDDGATPDGTATLTTSTTNQTHDQNKVLLKNSSGDYTTGRAPRVAFRDDADDGSWVLEGFDLDFQLLRGRKRS